MKDGELVHPVRLYELPGDTLRGNYFDAWELRDAFLRLQSDEAVLGFLKATGSFSGLFKDGIWGFDEMRGWQSVFRMMMKKEPWDWDSWFQARPQYKQHLAAFVWKHHEMPASLRWQKTQNSLVFRASDTLSAIYMTIVLDKLAGSKFGFCARKDCRKPFEIRAHPNKKYCSNECAHLEVVRRARARRRK